jgi:hypothetical protein
MDALGAYGSDTSSDDASSSHHDAKEKEEESKEALQDSNKKQKRTGDASFPRMDLSLQIKQTVNRILADEHKFQNPHSFAAAVDELGISNCLASHLPTESFEEWEENDLERLEQQARFRRANEQQQQTSNPSQFAQHHLEEAMQQRRGF